MKITLNGQHKNTSENINLENLIQEFCKDLQHIVAEVNGDIVKKERWEKQLIADGDSVELVNIVGGG